MGYGEIITRALQSMRSRSLWLFAAAGAVLYLPAFVVIIAAVLRWTEFSVAVSAAPVGAPDIEGVLAMMRAMPWLSLASLLGGALGIPAYVFIETGVALHTRAFLGGDRPSVADLMARTKAVYFRALTAYATLYGPWLAAYAVCMLVLGLAGENFILGLIERGDTTGVLVWTFVIGVLSIVLVVGTLVAFISSIFTVRAVALDGSAPLPAIRWSFTFLRRVSRQMVVMYLMIYLVQMAYSMLLSLVTTPLIMLGVFGMSVRLPATGSPQEIAAVVSQSTQTLMPPLLLLSAVTAAPMIVFVSAAWTAFYLRALGRPLFATPASPAPAPEVAHV